MQQLSFPETQSPGIPTMRRSGDSDTLRIVFAPASSFASNVSTLAFAVDSAGKPVRRLMKGIGSGRVAALYSLIDQAKKSGDTDIHSAAMALHSAGADAVAAAEWREWPTSPKPAA